MRPLFHSYRQNGVSRTELFSLPPLRAEKRGGGGGGEWHCLVPLEMFFGLLYQPDQRLSPYL